jgi:hypothetical protein
MPSSHTQNDSARGRTIAAACVICVFVLGLFAFWGIQRGFRTARVREAHSRAQQIALALFNFISSFRCLPEPISEKGGRWREQLWGYFGSSPIPPLAVIQAGPATVFNVVDRKSHATNVYAITGVNSAFATENRCRLKQLPKSCVLFVSGGQSSEPWYAAADISLAELRRHAGPIRDLTGETFVGVIFVIFADGDTWAIDSATPCELLARCASVSETNDSVRAELTKYRLHHFEQQPGY